MSDCLCWVGHGDCGGCSGYPGITHEPACGFEWNPKCPTHGSKLDLTDVPEHMHDYVQFYNYWAPRFYEESECENCGNPIYRYKMDLIVSWKHFNHAEQCSLLMAKPIQGD